MNTDNFKNEKMQNSNIEQIAEMSKKLEKVIVQMDNLFDTSLLITETNLFGYFVRSSRGWQELFGYTAEEVAAKPWVYFVHPDDIQPTLDVYTDMKNGKALTYFVNRYRCADGTYKKLLWNAAGFDDVERAKKTGTLYCTAIEITNKE